MEEMEREFINIVQKNIKSKTIGKIKPEVNSVISKLIRTRTKKVPFIEVNILGY